MRSKPLVTSSQRSFLRARFLILSEDCFRDQGNPSTCPFLEILGKSQKEKTAWFDGLNEEAILNIHTYCQLCWNKKKIL